MNSILAILSMMAEALYNFFDKLSIQRKDGTQQLDVKIGVAIQLSTTVFIVLSLVQALTLSGPVEANPPVLALTALATAAMLINLVASLKAMQKSSAGEVVAVMSGGSTIAIVLLSAFILGSRLSPLVFMGSVPVVAGVVILSQNSEHGSATALLWALLAALSQAAFSIFNAEILKMTSTQNSLFWQYSWRAVCGIAYLLWLLLEYRRWPPTKGQRNHTHTIGETAKRWKQHARRIKIKRQLLSRYAWTVTGLSVFIAFAANLTAFLAQSNGLNVAKVAVVNSAAPALVYILSVIWLKEQLKIVGSMAILLIVGGCALVMAGNSNTSSATQAHQSFGSWLIAVAYLVGPLAFLLFLVLLRHQEKHNNDLETKRRDELFQLLLKGGCTAYMSNTGQVILLTDDGRAEDGRMVENGQSGHLIAGINRKIFLLEPKASHSTLAWLLKRLTGKHRRTEDGRWQHTDVDPDGSSPIQMIEDL